LKLSQALEVEQHQLVFANELGDLRTKPKNHNVEKTKNLKDF